MRGCGAALAFLLCATGCTVVPPDADAGGTGKVPGAPFETNTCFRCALSACNVSVNACLSNLDCSAWLSCVGDCPTAGNGVSADHGCFSDCPLPVSANVLYECIQSYANYFYSGCEAACTELPRDAGTD